MANLYYFFHYHRGGMKDKTIKIAGSFLAATMLFTWSFSDIVAVSAEETAQINSQMVPESGYRPETTGPFTDTQNGTPPMMGGNPQMQMGQPGQMGQNPQTMMQPPLPMQGNPAMPQGVNGGSMMDQGRFEQLQGKKQMDDQGRGMPSLQKGSGSDMGNGGKPTHSTGLTGKQGDNGMQGMKNMQNSNMQQDMQGDQGDQQDSQDAMNKQRLAQELPRTLKEISQMQRELTRLCNQLKRLKGTEDDLASCAALQGKVQGYVDALKSSTDDDALQTAMEDYHDSNIWDDISKVRFKIEVPKTLNRMVIELARAEKLLNQKALQSIVDVAGIRTKLAEVKASHEAMKTCYAQGDFECVQEKMDDLHDQNPMELFGVLQMLRGLSDMSRYIKDKDAKAEIDGLMDPVIQSINQGDWQQARQDLEAIQKELQDIMKSIMMSQKNRGGGVSSGVQERLDKLKAKYQSDVSSQGDGTGDQAGMDSMPPPTTATQP